MVAWSRAFTMIVATAVVAGGSGLVGLSTASSATAATATVPGAPTFPATIDAFPRYESENTCSPTAKPGAVEVRRILRVTYGSSISSNITRACSKSDSGHEEGRAIDWMVSQRSTTQRAMGDAFVGWLLAADKFGNARAMGRRLGVQYVIWKSRIIMFTSAGAQWREYSTCLTKRTTKADDTYCHRNHVHISLTWAGAKQKTTWYTLRGLPACTSAGETPLPAATTQRAATAVTVPVTTVLDTTDGIGTPRLAVPCRLASDGTLLVRTAGLGGVPTSGLAEVTLRVTAKAAGLSTEVFPRDPVVVGGATPSEPPSLGGRPTLTLAPGASGSATWTVRTTSNGQAALRLGPAVQRVVVAVVGYRLAGTGPDTAKGGSGSSGSDSSGSPTAEVDVTTRHLPVGG